MEFEKAAHRLQQEQSKLRGRNHNNHVSAKAKREADYRKRQHQLMQEQRQRLQAKNDYLRKVWNKHERMLRVRDLAPTGGLYLRATSIHGDGDKIALPPSVLERLTQTIDSQNEVSASPWIFRVGIPNPKYSFPASLTMQNLKIPIDEAMEDDSDDDDDEKNEKTEYLDELSQKYITYAYSTVVEFTQDEGHVGLPASIAAALLDSKRRRTEEIVPSMRTKDPSQMDVISVDPPDEDRTPGHLAWGAFDVPDVELEISLVTLPKGRGCTLVPTMDAIRHGFHQLKDVKLVLEQSLVRTRATLSVGDTVHTWHRGVKFDLEVTEVTPADWQSISCVNTDVEVNIGANEQAEQLETVPMSHENPGKAKNHSLLRINRILDSKTQSNGQVQLGKKLLDATSSNTTKSPFAGKAHVPFRPEPPADQTDGICTIQIRADNGSGRRRFDVNIATVQDVFSFAASLTSLESFQLVTRFPRRILIVQDAILSAAGILPGQELFLVEPL